jgi:plasmid maintenance system killer protein
MKDITMKIETLKSTTIRLTLGSGESDTYYLHKGNKSGTWSVRQNE